MKIWRFRDPADDHFASGGRLGAWTDSGGDGVCPGCTDSRQYRRKPLIMDWQPGSDVVGDFVWVGLSSEVVVTDRVLNVLQENFTGFEAGPVEMVPNGSSGNRRKPRVALPYQGRPLSEIWVTAWVHLDPDRSSVEHEKTCGVCGREFWTLYGVEQWDSHWDPQRRELIRTKTERLPNAGAFVRENDLDGAEIFRVKELPAWVLCTDKVRELIQKEGFSNVSFLQVGDTC